MVPIAIYGAGGSAREVAWLAGDCRDAGQPLDVVGFIDDNAASQGQVINGIRVRSLEQTLAEFPAVKVIGAIGNCAVRERVVAKLGAAGVPTLSLIHPTVIQSSWLEVGEGAVICARSILSVNVRIGRHVQINFACTVAHDAMVGDFATLAPGVHLSGAVHLGKRVYVGSGAVIKNGTPTQPIVIGDDAVIGAGACVTKSVAPGLTVVGVPARPIQR